LGQEPIAVAFVDEAVTVVIHTIALFRFGIGRGASSPGSIKAGLGAVAAIGRTVLLQFFVSLSVAVIVHAVALFTASAGAPGTFYTGATTNEIADLDETCLLLAILFAKVAGIALKTFVHLPIAVIIFGGIIVADFGVGLTLRPIAGGIALLSAKGVTVLIDDASLSFAGIAFLAGAIKAGTSLVDFPVAIIVLAVALLCWRHACLPVSVAVTELFAHGRALRNTGLRGAFSA